jgi:hypothetical protein
MNACKAADEFLSKQFLCTHAAIAGFLGMQDKTGRMNARPIYHLGLSLLPIFTTCLIDLAFGFGFALGLTWTWNGSFRGVFYSIKIKFEMGIMDRKKTSLRHGSGINETLL